MEYMNNSNAGHFLTTTMPNPFLNMGKVLFSIHLYWEHVFFFS